MLKVNKIIEGAKAVVSPEGRLDTVTAPELESVVREIVPQVEELIFDFSALEYVSSAGLRVLLSAQKAMNGRGTMKIRGVNDMVAEIFEVTGFADFLTVE